MSGYARSRPRFQRLREGSGRRGAPGSALRFGGCGGEVGPRAEDAGGLAGEQRQEVLLDAVRGGLDDPPDLLAAAADDDRGQVADVVLLQQAGGLLLGVVDADV